MSYIQKMVDSIINDINGGLRGYHTNMSLSKELLAEEVVLYRISILKEYILKGTLPVADLTFSLNCIPVDCDNIAKCPCNTTSCGEPLAHFQIPQLLFDFGLNKAIQYVGSTDKQHPFLVYTKALDLVNKYLKYRKRGKNKPWVYIDITPNKNGLLDCYIFNAPLIKSVSIQAIFKDLRLLDNFSCDCEQDKSDENFSFIDILVKERLTKLKLQYYRLYQPPLIPNNQEYTAG